MLGKPSAGVFDRGQVIAARMCVKGEEWIRLSTHEEILLAKTRKIYQDLIAHVVQGKPPATLKRILVEHLNELKDEPRPLL